MTFFDKYSYKQKNYALAILAVLLLAVSYKRAFKTTIETLSYRNELKLKLTESANAFKEIKLFQAQIMQLNKLLGKENVTIERVQQGFLNFFAKKSSGISVFQIDEVLTFQHPDFKINTHRITLKGDFIPVLKFIYQLEKEFELAKIINIGFEYKKYNSDENEDLYTVILIQNYER